MFFTAFNTPKLEMKGVVRETLGNRGSWKVLGAASGVGVSSESGLLGNTSTLQSNRATLYMEL